MRGDGEFRDSGAEPARTPLSRKLVLGALTAVPALSTTIYLPGLPDMADDLGASTSAAQLTISGFVAGLAGGQLVAGPLSDRLGRRRPIIGGLLIYVASALACALAPSVTVLIVARFALGLSGAAGLVIARATVRDLHTGAAAVRLFSVLMLVMGVAPIVAPVLGGQLLALGSWRTIFLGASAIGALLALAVVVVLPESLPPGRRQKVALGATLRTPARLLCD
ncbi:MAG TPA: MFS transporter, partial [Baekduia sp.]|nr:MFS transporter [Baekduia sp.]